MRKKFTLFICGLAVLFAPSLINAQVRVSEKMMSVLKNRQMNRTEKSVIVKKPSILTPKSVTANVNLFGVRIFDTAATTYDDVVSFSSATPGTVTSLASYDANDYYVAGGDYYNGNLYVSTYYSDETNYYYGELITTSANSWSNINSIELEALVFTISYDYSTNTMYVLGLDDQGDDYLGTIDLVTGSVTKINNLDRYFMTLSISLSGTLYGVDSDGNFCTINKTTAAVTLIGSTGVDVYYAQSTGFDYSTGTLYWAMCNSTDDGKLLQINTSTGAVTDLGTLGGDAEVMALHVPYAATSTNNPLFADLKISNTTKGEMKISALKENSSVAIYDLSGRAVKQFSSVSNDLKIDLSSGIYLVEVTTSGDKYTQKVVVK